MLISDKSVAATLLATFAALLLAGCSAPGEDLAESTQPEDTGGPGGYNPPPGSGSPPPFVNETEDVSGDLDTVPGAPGVILR